MLNVANNKRIDNNKLIIITNNSSVNHLLWVFGYYYYVNDYQALFFILKCHYLFGQLVLVCLCSIENRNREKKSKSATIACWRSEHIANKKPIREWSRFVQLQIALEHEQSKKIKKKNNKITSTKFKRN